MIAAMNPDTATSIGDQVKHWRKSRRFSQLELALAAEMSTRHLSFIETGRAAPSRDMVLRLGQQLDVPLRARNQMLLAAGFAPVYAERKPDDPDLQATMAAVQKLLDAHAPYPALAIDRHWNLVAANKALAPLLAGVAQHLMASPVNVLRLALHPDGVAPRILNLGEWRQHLLERLTRQIAATGDATLTSLKQELETYPAPKAPLPGTTGIAVPLQLQSALGSLSFLSTTLVFGAPRDVTLAELAIEMFLPVDQATADALRAMLS